MAIFLKRRQPIDYNAYRCDTGQYIEDYKAFHNQPEQTKRELKTIKLIMFILIPAFSLFSFFYTPASCIAGLVCGSLLFYFYYAKRFLRPAVASLVSIAIGILFGFWFQHTVRVSQ
jgi:hypothetical protein